MVHIATSSRNKSYGSKQLDCPLFYEYEVLLQDDRMNETRYRTVELIEGARKTISVARLETGKLAS
jgi:hypothetical protein